MAILDENFLINNASVFNLDRCLPLRLQKRQLLNLLKFPINKNLKSCLSKDRYCIELLFKEYSQKSFPFLVIVSQKPSPTIIPPLFMVRAVNKIIWRNDIGEKKEISYMEMLNVLNQFNELTWLEFVDCIWTVETIAGRLIYINPNKQIIELQKGVLPSRLLSKNEFSLYGGSFSFLDLQIQNYREDYSLLNMAGYDKILNFQEVKNIVDYLANYFTSFEQLVKVSPMPTLEFGVLSDQTFIFIDIDWPLQWKE